VDAGWKQARDRVGYGKQAGQVLVAVTGRGRQSDSPVSFVEPEQGKVLRREIAALKAKSDGIEARRVELKVYEIATDYGS
jgi:hypothetical protein